MGRERKGWKEVGGREFHKILESWVKGKKGKEVSLSLI